MRRKLLKFGSRKAQARQEIYAALGPWLPVVCHMCYRYGPCRFHISHFSNVKYRPHARHLVLAGPKLDEIKFVLKMMDDKFRAWGKSTREQAYLTAVDRDVKCLKTINRHYPRVETVCKNLLEMSGEISFRAVVTAHLDLMGTARKEAEVVKHFVGEAKELQAVAITVLNGRDDCGGLTGVTERIMLLQEAVGERAKLVAQGKYFSDMRCPMLWVVFKLEHDI